MPVFTIKTLNLVFMKAKVVLWKHTTLKDGTHPIKIKITQTINGVTKERYTPIGAHALPVQWDEVNRRAKPNHPNSQAINIKIASMMLDIQNQMIRDEDVNFAKVGGGNVVEYFEDILKEIKAKHSALYYLGMNAVKNKLRDFNPDLTFSKLKLSDIRAFEHHLIGLGNGKTTIHHNLKRLKYICSLAVKDGIMEYTKNPFLNYTLEGYKTKKNRMPYEKIQEIEKLHLIENTPIWHVRNYWLFSFYCAGIRFGDMSRLLKSNVVKSGREYRLVYTMNKTTKHRRIFMTEKAVEIYKLYEKHPGPLLFPILKTIHVDKFKQQEAISRANASANKYLKTLEKMVISDIKLSFHSSRHSFADYAKKSGLDTHTIKDLLGHDKITTTEIYMSSFYEEETEAAMKKLFK